MSTTITPTTPTRKNKTWLTRDERLTVRALRSQNLIYEQIASQLGITYRQVQTACTADRPIPRKSRGQRRKLSEDQLDEIIEFITSSKETRRMPYETVIKELQLPVCKSTLRKALARREYHRCKALQKPPIAERTRIIRLNWALEHVNWTREQWCKALWTDESWVTSVYHRQIYVTRRSGEEFDETCVREHHQRLGGWIFWGSFFGTEKGPCLFWEKDWGNITVESYGEHILPLIDGIARLTRERGDLELLIMQDGAPSHRNILTIEELQNRGSNVIEWPPYSPGLNPIEQVWDWMKEWIGQRYLMLRDRRLSYDQLRRPVKAA